MTDLLRMAGWCTLETNSPLEELAHEFGEPVPVRPGAPIKSRLMVQEQEQGHPNSLTSRHGTGPFPFHTDGAHFPRVPRYILLRLAQGAISDRPTRVIDIIGQISAKHRRILETERWKFSTGRRCFISPVLSPQGLRFDTGIMRPAVPARHRSWQLIHETIGAIEPADVNWREGITVVIDNHRMLHARAAGLTRGENRILERIMVI